MPLINASKFPWLQSQQTSPTPTTPQTGPSNTVPMPNLGGQYQGMIQNDPFFMQSKALLDAQSAADSANISKQLQQLLIQYGQVPEGFQSPYLSATTGPLAQQNTDAGLSILARLNKSMADSRRGLLNERAARGTLRSGGTGSGLGRLALVGKQAQYDAGQQVLNMVDQMLTGGTQASFARQQSLLDAMMNAYLRQLSLGQNRTV
jgi:hypothetical protein